MNSNHDDRAADTDDVVRRLMQAAGEREVPPVEHYEQTLAVATSAWQRTVRRQRQQRMRTWSVAAALLVGCIVVATVQLQVPERTPAIARVERVIGSASARTEDGREWSRLNDQVSELTHGTRIRTGPGSRLGLVLANEVSLRMAESTDVQLQSPTRVQLLSGKVYVDTHSLSAARQPSGASIEIVTRVGRLRDVGTQFEMSCAEQQCRVRVREGKVVLQQGAAGIEGNAGEELRLDTVQLIERTRLEPTAAAYEWAQSVAPAPDIDNQPVTTLLEWVARETGRNLKYAGTDVEHKAAQTILHGSIRHLAPLDALRIMLATTDFEYALADNDITIGLKVID